MTAFLIQMHACRSGSGCVISFFSKLMAPLAVACVASDLNRKACDATRLTGLQNGCSIDVLNTSLAGGIRRPANASSSSGASGGEHYHCGLFDVILYNPPYVPTEHEEIYHHTHDEEGLLRAAWAGGIDGRYWIDQVIPLMPQLLSARGVLYMILLDANRPDDLRREALERYGLSSEIVLRRRAGIEYLMVVKMWRS